MLKELLLVLLITNSMGQEGQKISINTFLSELGANEEASIIISNINKTIYYVRDVIRNIKPLSAGSCEPESSSIRKLPNLSVFAFMATPPYAISCYECSEGCFLNSGGIGLDNLDLICTNPSGCTAKVGRKKIYEEEWNYCRGERVVDQSVEIPKLKTSEIHTANSDICYYETTPGSDLISGGVGEKYVKMYCGAQIGSCKITLYTRRENAGSANQAGFITIGTLGVFVIRSVLQL